MSIDSTYVSSSLKEDSPIHQEAESSIMSSASAFIFHELAGDFCLLQSPQAQVHFLFCLLSPSCRRSNEN